MEDPLHSLVDTDAVLQPFLQAAQETSSAASNTATARALVAKVLSHPEIVCGYDQIKQALKESLEKAADGDKVMKTLDLFSYGTYADYMAAPHNYLTLTEAQIYKLRQLTVLTLVEQACQQKQSTLSYDTVQQTLQLDPSNKEAVEDILISCIYARVLRGQLCQKSRRLLLQQQGPPLCSRDVPPSRVADLLNAVRRLQESIQSATQDVQNDRRRVQKELEWNQQQVKTQRERTQRTKGLTSGHVAQSSAAWDLSGSQSDHGASAVASGQDPAAFMDVAAGASDDGHNSASRRQKRSRGGLTGMAESMFGGRFQF